MTGRSVAPVFAALVVAGFGIAVAGWMATSVGCVALSSWPLFQVTGIIALFVFGAPLIAMALLVIASAAGRAARRRIDRGGTRGPSPAAASCGPVFPR